MFHLTTYDFYVLSHIWHTMHQENVTVSKDFINIIMHPPP